MTIQLALSFSGGDFERNSPCFQALTASIPPAMRIPLSYRAAVQVHVPKQPPVASKSALALIVE